MRSLRVSCRLAVLTGATALVAGLAMAAPASAFVYWTNYADSSGIGGSGTTIGRVGTDGIGVENFIKGAKSPIGVAVEGRHIYWANVGIDSIGRANLDGSGTDQAFITGASLPEGVAVDGQHFYWANAFSDDIGRANLDGTGANQAFIKDLGSPDGVAVDAQHIYWTDPRERRDRARQPRRQRSRQELHHRRRRTGRNRGRRPAHLLGQPDRRSPRPRRRRSC